MPDISRERIFVQIASYRDPQCHATVRDLFEKAAHPERVFVGICWQYDPEEDQECFAQAYPRAEQVRVIQYHAREAQGAGWARGEAQSLWQGEEYTLQIQAHMRFEPGWDNTLIALLRNLPTEKSVLTAWLPGYVPPDKKLPLNGQLPLAVANRIGGEGDAQIVHYIKRMVALESVRGKLLPVASWIGNFMFARSSVLQEVPFDPYIYFWGEELNYSVRLFTHGYDIFHLDRVVLYHYWDRTDVKDEAMYRNHRQERNQLSLARNLHLLGIKPASDARALKDIEKYPLGAVRSLDEYWQFAGIDIRQYPLPSRGRVRVGAPSGTSPNDAPLPTSPLMGEGNLRIFVAMASYRDSECKWTLKDMFEKAKYPERIFAGVCLQVDPADEGCGADTDRPNQVRVKQIHARESRGANWARAEALALMQGEEYVLQIDSHMRFERGWDESLIEMLERCPTKKAVLSTYLPNYDPPDARDYQDGNTLIRIRVRKFGGKEDPQLVHVTGEFVARDDERYSLYPSPFYIANFMFTRAGTVKEVPIDPHFVFYGDEISYGARLWTHGYDIFQPDRIVMFHYWVRMETLHLQHYRNTKTPASKRSLKRVKHLLGLQQTHDSQALFDIEKYGLGSERALEDLWAFAGIDWERRVISADAEQGRWNMAARKKKNVIPSAAEGSKSKKDPSAPLRYAQDDNRIFVQIASYRDTECQWTVKDLFEKATHPERISVGICWQFDPQKDADCFAVSTRPEQVRMLPVDWREAEGVCWARHQTQQLWDGEEYTLQIDSHMRFMPGWDELMIEELAACEAEKPVISCSPAAYTPPNHLQPDPKPTVRRVQPFFPDGNIRGKGEALDRIPEKPLKGAFIAAGFVFSRSDIIGEVPYDPYMYFDQEEITYAARLYTSGWDVFSSRRPLLYHFYNDKPGVSVRPLHWRDLRQEDESKIHFLRDRGMKRFNHLMGHTPSADANVTRELERYGMGSVRTLTQFEEFTGIDFKRKIASEKALRCLFIEGLEKYRDKPITIPQIDGKPELPRAPSRVMPAPAPMVKALEVGDFIPLFEVDDTNHKTRGMEVHGGRTCMLFFLSAKNPDYLVHFFGNLAQKLRQHERMEIWQIFILDDTVENLLALKEKFKFPHVLSADPGRKIAQAFGLCRSQDATVPPAGYVLNTNLKIISRRSHMPPQQLANIVVDDCRSELEKYQAKNQQRRVITEMAPALIVPNVFSPEFCRTCIEAFHAGPTFEGTVGAEEKTAYRPTAKARRDYIVNGALLDEIDDKLSRSLFPEIKKVFGFDVAHREFYKIGQYSSENGGFFKQHRDNFDVPLGYRRVAMTLHLNDDYEGGGLHFPEYDNNTYKPALGGAIAFSCSTLHEAWPVTRGERFVLVGFMHGKEDEAFRQHYAESKGLPLKTQDYAPVLRQYSGLRFSRDFFKEWQEGHVRIDTGVPYPAVKRKT